MASPEARERFARKNEEDDLRRAFDFLDRKKDGKIDEDDLTQVFMSLQHKTKKGEINDMIWEVDEDCDNAVNWKVHSCTAPKLCTLRTTTTRLSRSSWTKIQRFAGVSSHVSQMQKRYSWHRAKAPLQRRRVRYERQARAGNSVNGECYANNVPSIW
jgi:hypothetical protein